MRSAALPYTRIDVEPGLRKIILFEILFPMVPAHPRHRHGIPAGALPCGKLMVAAPFGLAITNFVSPEAVAGVVGKARRPSVIWLHMQDCTGCTETLLRTSEPDLSALIFDVISLDCHETIMAASGTDAEAALKDAMSQNDGKYVLVVTVEKKAS